MAKAITYSNNTEMALELLTATAVIGHEGMALSINNDEQAGILQEAGAKVLKVTADINIADTNAIAETIKKAAAELGADTVLLSSDRRGKELAGRVAQKLDTGCLTDIKNINVNGTVIECERNALGGATIAVQSIKSSKKVLAISPKVFKAADKAPGGSMSEFTVGEIVSAAITVREVIAKYQDNVDIADADVLVAVGCGVENQSNLPLVKAVADKLGASIGCSKPVATDWKWFAEERIIGLSGKLCSPELALILGVSGQVQFAVGVRAAKAIISINKDENAPMNSQADYYLVADLNEVLNELKQALE